MERRSHHRTRQLPTPSTGQLLEITNSATELRTGHSQRKGPLTLTSGYPSRLSLGDLHRLQAASTLATSSAYAGERRPDTLRPAGS